MIIKKITTGFVIQTFDTDTNKFVEQEFIAGDEVTHEDEVGNEVSEDLVDPYLPFDMVQPK